MRIKFDDFLGWHSSKSQNSISNSNSKTKNMNLNQCDFELMSSCLRVAVRRKLISANDLAIPIVRFCTTPLYRYTCTLYMCTYGLTRHYYIVLCLVHTVYDALLLNYAFPFLISFVFSEKKFIFVKAFVPMAQQSLLVYWKTHFRVAKAHTNYRHNRLVNWQGLHNYSEDLLWFFLFKITVIHRIIISIFSSFPVTNSICLCKG